MGSSLSIAILPDRDIIGYDTSTISGIINMECVDRFDVSSIPIIMAVDLGKNMADYISAVKYDAKAVAETFSRHPLTLVTFGNSDSILVKSGSSSDVIAAIDRLNRDSTHNQVSSPVGCINFIARAIDSGIVIMFTDGGTPMPLRSARIHDDRLHSQVKMLEACFIDYGSQHIPDLFSLSLEMQGLYLDAELDASAAPKLLEWVQTITAKNIKIELVCSSGRRIVEVSPFVLNVHAVTAAKHYKIYLPFLRSTGTKIVFKISVREIAPGEEETPILMVCNVYVKNVLYTSKELRIKRTHDAARGPLPLVTKTIDEMAQTIEKLKAVVTETGDLKAKCCEFSLQYREAESRISPVYTSII